jgi:hypothetical protein
MNARPVFSCRVRRWSSEAVGARSGRPICFVVIEGAPAGGQGRGKALGPIHLVRGSQSRSRRFTSAYVHPWSFRPCETEARAHRLTRLQLLAMHEACPLAPVQNKKRAVKGNKQRPQPPPPAPPRQGPSATRKGWLRRCLGRAAPRDRGSLDSAAALLQRSQSGALAWV